MANSDFFAPAPDGSAEPDEHGGDSPRIVPLSSSFDLGEFPSESPGPSAQPPATSMTLADGPADTPAAIEALPQESTALDISSRQEFEPQINPPLVAKDSLPTPTERGPGTGGRGPHGDAQRTLADLLERHGGGLGWRETVGIVYELCLKLQNSPTQAPILLEPRNIEISNAGEVDLLPSQTGGDPLVIQVGRLLRTMLAGQAIPPELRLLLSQATFELPIFKSVADLAKALQQVGDLRQTEDVRTALMIESQPVLVPAPPLPENLQPVRPILQMPSRGPRSRTQRRQLLSADAALVGSFLLVAVLLMGLILNRSSPAPPFANATPPNAVAPLVAMEAPPSATGAAAPLDRSANLPSPRPAADPSLPRGMTGSAPAAHTSKPTDRPRSGTPQPGAVEYHALPYEPSSPAGPRIGSSAPTAVSPRETERRAAALIAEGQAHEASMVFDALVLSNPLYEPKGQDLTPEALAAFRASKKLLLPVIAMRDYDRAKTALTTGDPERALVLGNHVNAILDRIDAEPAPNMRRNVQELVDKATSAKLSMDDVVYSRPGAGIVGPRLLSRGFPATTPVGCAGEPRRNGGADCRKAGRRRVRQALYPAQSLPRTNDRQRRQSLALPARHERRQAGQVPTDGDHQPA